MATLSKKDNDLLIRLSVLERLVDKLMDRVAVAEASVKGTEGTVQEMLRLVQSMQQEVQDDWPTPPQPKEGEENGAYPDEVSSLVET